MGRGTRNYDEVWAKLQELRELREVLCEIVDSDDHNALMKWLESQKKLAHPCPGKFLRGHTKPKQESEKRTWMDFIDYLKRKNTSQKNIDYIMEKLSLCDSLDEASKLFNELYVETKSNFTDLKEKSLHRSFNQTQNQ